ncbi:helix-turn-helix transcriptional regulator [Chitinophaga agrisoli]|uniref:Helix-turn-helix transcriptional regulator n=1 Tax=Chitinophaga agrisoli TaxID=2607653 RepID=A0A5B2VR71_9BACT|nr:helix-turn-helix transcriptional regulator [Chitinophaga agrisoli]KAA2240639.1 helix-turn-helix transcriptional regulator [Chitinophaga agrisoli]
MEPKTVTANPTSRVTAKLRSLRRRKEYSQEYMAFMLNISQNAYSRLENGKTPLTINRLFDICALLNVPPADLLGPDIFG